MGPSVLFTQLAWDLRQITGALWVCVFLIGTGNFELDTISALTLHMVGEGNGSKENVASPSLTSF